MSEVSRSEMIHRDHGKGRIMKALLGMSNQRVMVGWPGDGPVHSDVEHTIGKSGKIRTKKHKRSAGMTVAQIAVVHEFGAPLVGIPARPVMAQTNKKYREAMGPLQARLLKQIYEGKLSEAQALKQLGVFWEGRIKAMFREGTFAKLKPATIAAKGSSAPLIDTAQLRNSCTSRVVRV